MENLIEFFSDNTLYQTYIVEDDENIIGTIRADCHEEFALLHPKIYIVNKVSLQKYKKAFEYYIGTLSSKLHYEHIYADTKKDNIVRFLTNGKAICVGKGVEGMLYEHKIIQ